MNASHDQGNAGRQRQKSRPSQGKTPARALPQGAAARLVAAQITGLVVGGRASLDDLADREKGFDAFTRLEARDQALARAIAVTALRHRMQIRAMLARCWTRPPPARAELLNSLLETATAQIAFMQVPASAAANLAVALISSDPRSARFTGFANAVLRKIGREQDGLAAATATVDPFPAWLQKTLQRDHGKARTGAIGQAFRQAPALDLNGRDGYRALFADGMPLPGTSLRLAGGGAVESLPGFADGRWWVQDVAAAQPARLLDLCLEGGVSGRPIADLCAAPGGKTLQLAAMGAQVTAVDVSARRLRRLSENLQRTQLSAKIVCADLLGEGETGQPGWQPEERFDGILLDASCTATGTIRRHPDIVWNTRAEDIAVLASLQRRMIERAAGWLKPGGVLVYANCSLFKEEGENLAASLDLPGLAHRPVEARELPGLETSINGQGNFRSLLHHKAGEAEGMDGFFAACFRRQA
ncbi:MAG: MFS transporter [Nitratireductor sp.]|nr:MFS transporter [Nitratireductor sp.]